MLDEFAVTAVTIGFDMPPELRHTAGQDASAQSFVRLSAPELAVITTVATSISNTFIGPSLIPADGPLVVDIVSANGEVLAGPFDVSELRHIPTEHNASPTIRVRTNEQSGWEVAVVARTAAVSPPPRSPPAVACLATTGPTQITRPYRSGRR